MNRAILVLNAGSSSIKFALFGADEGEPRQATLSGQIEGIGGETRLRARSAADAPIADAAVPAGGDAQTQHHRALDYLLGWLAEHDAGWHVTAAGHRVVHGGELFAAPMRVTGDLLEKLDGLVPLAPLHQPHNLEAIRALAALNPELPQVACFDTAFHRTQPAVAQAFALPRALSSAGIRRYGFHGLSYEYIAHVLPTFIGLRADGRVVAAHLGNGASMCGMRGRRSIASSMGFTALEGLMMGTRSGSLDPGVLLYLMQFKGMDADRLSRLLYNESGLLGVSGLSQDMRVLLASARPEASEAVNLFCYRASRELGSLAAALGGLDALVFAGGIGEHAAEVRARVCKHAEWLGIRLDEAANLASRAVISAPGSAVDVVVVPANEEWMIARHTAGVLGDELEQGRAEDRRAGHGQNSVAHAVNPGGEQ